MMLGTSDPMEGRANSDWGHLENFEVTSHLLIRQAREIEGGGRDLDKGNTEKATILEEIPFPEKRTPSRSHSIFKKQCSDSQNAKREETSRGRRQISLENKGYSNCVVPLLAQTLGSESVRKKPHLGG